VSNSGKPERAILDVLVDHWPAAVPVETIAAAIGYSPTSGGSCNALSRIRIRIRIRIRTLHIAAGRGELLLNDTLIDPPEAPGPDHLQASSEHDEDATAPDPASTRAHSALKCFRGGG